MSIRFEHAVEVAQSPERAFAVLDDLALTPRWLERCIGVETLTPGPNQIGSKLRYTYREGGRTGQMDGEIIARTPGERLTCRYQDAMMDVTVDFRVARTASGARLVHAIEIAPKTFVAKLLSPLIRRQLPKQTITAMASLKVLLESS